VSETRRIGSGAVRDVRWILEAGGDDDGYWTGLEVIGPADYLCRGGMAGPKLCGEDVLNTYTGRSDDGPLGIVVRADPAVTRAVILAGDGDEFDLLACGSGVVDGLRFYVGFAWPTPPSGKFGLHELRAYDDDGNLLATDDLSFWDRMRNR
jgi:hypothetical protein